MEITVMDMRIMTMEITVTTKSITDWLSSVYCQTSEFFEDKPQANLITKTL